ncbi:MAG: hypothetical protein EBS86_14960 [Crocinitomicaceae bacterium]|nr:hypothetical protein [Crocinitomicaceae bacterium]
MKTIPKIGDIVCGYFNGSDIPSYGYVDGYSVSFSTSIYVFWFDMQMVTSIPIKALTNMTP